MKSTVPEPAYPPPPLALPPHLCIYNRLNSLNNIERGCLNVDTENASTKDMKTTK